MTPDIDEIKQLNVENVRLRRLLDEAQAESRGLKQLTERRIGRWLVHSLRPILRVIGRQAKDHWPDPRQLGQWSIAGADNALTADSGPVMAGETDWPNPERPTINTLAICHPDWRGVRSSVENLFDTRLFVRDNVTPHRATQLARWIANVGFQTVVFNGLPSSHELLMEALRRHAPAVRLLAIWHGNFMQLDEPNEWRGIRALVEHAQAGHIMKIGFVKQGMAEVLARRGVTTAFIMNYVRRIPTEASRPSPGGPHLGLWAIEPIWRKLPYTMVAGSALVRDAQVWSTGQNQRARELAQFLGVSFQTLSAGALEQDEMPVVLARMHVNLYVTLSECAPMLPLESLAVGVPCLIGPNSHYFRDHETLRRWLVVPYPDNPRAISDTAIRAIEERSAIIEHYRRYAIDMNQQARESCAHFLA